MTDAPETPKAPQPSPVLPASLQLSIPPHIAANICKMLERVQVTGPEAFAWVEAYGLMQRISVPPGVPFIPMPPTG